MKKLYSQASMFLAIFVIFFNFSALSSTLPNGFAELRLAEGLDGTTVNYAPDGRLFVTQKKGLISIIKNGVLIATPFMDLQSEVDNTNERGLQNMTFDPNFATNGYIYIYYTAVGMNRNRVVRVTASGDVVVPGSEVILLTLDVLASNIHNGGALFFSGGKLFITTGEGSNGSLAQSFSSLLGKVLRINPDGSIPTDNPFYLSLVGNYRMIYALGFRNPYRAAVQPGTGRVFINDVGNASWEEINELGAGKNYGWPNIEGNITDQVPPSNYQNPVYTYPHSQGCCVGGGAFYNPTSAGFPSSYVGKYFFGDYCGNYIKVLDPDTGVILETFATNINRPISFSIGADGSFYYLSRGGDANTQSCCSEVWRIQFTNNGVPTISAQPEDELAPIGGQATFVVGASGNAPLSYQWQKNGVNIPGATLSTYTILSAALSDNGSHYRVVVTNPLGTVTSYAALLTVTNNLPPLPIIILPTAGYYYEAGTIITFFGTATDPEDGVLPESAFTWEITFHHNTHTHPGLAPTSGIEGGTFELEDAEPATTVWYRVHLTVTDSQGQQATVYRDIFPIVVNVTLAANKPGLKLELDGADVTSPNLFQGVAGVIREIAAPSPQTLNGITYNFVSWSNGGTQDHYIVTPSTSSTISAYYLPLLLEAEDATLSGAQMKYGYMGFSGTGYADYVNASGDYVEWTFSVPNTAVYKLDFRYANGTAKDRPLNVTVNGVLTETNKPFPSSGGWASWALSTSQVTLNAGTNTVRLTTNGANGGNVDYLLVSSTGPVTPTVTAPNFTPVAGTYTGEQVVTISTPTSGADIYYTLDGSIPTTSSLHFVTPIVVSSAATIKAYAVKTGMNNSSISSATFTINTNTNEPFAITLEAEDAVLSGVVKKASYAGFTGTGYGDYINASNDYIEWTVTIPSDGDYQLDFRYSNGSGKDRPLQIMINGGVDEPSESFPPTGLWTTYGEVSSIFDLEAGINIIRLTAIGSSGGNLDHLTISSTGLVTPTVVAPQFSPVAGNYTSVFLASISTSTSGATIYYTLDGSTPSQSSLVYSSPISITAATTIKAFASATGMNNSPVVTASYTMNTSQVPFSVLLESENATRLGVAVKFSYTGFTGTGYGDYMANSGEYIEWTTTVPQAGQYVLDFRYANGTAKSRPLDIAVNGVIVESNKPFPGTGGWTNWAVVSNTVNLNGGANTVRATSTGLSGANLDHLQVSNTTLLSARVATASVENLAIQEEENSIEKDILVYPIPAQNILTVKSKTIINVINVETIQGVTHNPSTNRRSDYEWEVNLANLTNGLYILNVKTGNKTIKHKIIIDK